MHSSPPKLILDIVDLIRNNKLEDNSSLVLSAINDDPNNIEYLFNLGIECVENGRSPDALIIFKCLRLANPDDVRIPYNIGFINATQNNFEDALQSFEEALNISPSDVEVLTNYANTQHELKQYDAAILSYEKALNLQPDFAQAWMNKGVALHELKRYDEALNHLDMALSLAPEYYETWAQKGVLLNALKKHKQSAQCFLRALELCPEDSYFLGKAHHQMMLVCDWTNYENITSEISNRIRQHRRCAEPFGLQGIETSEEVLRECAEIYANDIFPAMENILSHSKYSHKKIRIGYVCGEFREQATSMLLTRIWELHDNSKFEIFAFDSGFGDDSEYRYRIEQAFKSIVDISRISDLEAAKLIQSNEIDILVNLNGYFGHVRQGIFAYKPAPIQVNYLGFPGTIGAAYIDYMIADDIVVPLESRKYYIEKIAYLPSSYQANDNRRIISQKKFERGDFGLPENYFVFACFNNNYKITPATFDLWSRILERVEGSVLWLLADNPLARENLIKEAAVRGIDSTRLIFAERLKPLDHLARHQLADLFIDTLPYNAHTTCSDALWAGLPVLTLMGSTFPGRVSASLLNALDLSELITHTESDYLSLAVELATNQEKLKEIRVRLASSILEKPLFNSESFTKHLEAVYIKMMERYRADLQPDHITII